MKTIITLLSLFTTLTTSAQLINPLDTMLIRQEITMQAGDWALMRGKIGAVSDSAIDASDRRINTLIKPLLPLQWTSNVTIDSLPGKLVLMFFQALKTSPAGEIVSRYTAINNALSGVTQLQFWFGYIEANLQNDFIRFRNIGKNKYIDN